MKTHTLVSSLLSAVVACWWANPAAAAPTTQSFTLSPGWNAVFLEVEPPSTNPAEVFSATRFDPIADLVAVWRWVPSTSTVEFIQDETSPIPKGSQWLVYDPAQPAVSNLTAIHGETAYLIRLSETSGGATWTVRGEPTLPYIDWKTDSFNFVGFHLDPGAPPLFDDFFSSSLAHDDPNDPEDPKIFILDNASGDWEEVSWREVEAGEPEPKRPDTIPMVDGEAFWIYCGGSSQFTGPISVQPDQSSGLHYGATLSEQNLMLRNNSAAEKTLSLVLSDLTDPVVADTVHYWVFDPIEEFAGWTPFSSPPAPNIPAGGSQRLRLGVKRASLPPLPPPPTTYEANLTVTDGEGTRILVPVSVASVGYAGLWVGDATITKVSQPANTDDDTTPVATGSEFSFRLILHAPGSGNATLLSQVIQMWQEGTWMPDPDDLGKLIVDEPGSFVLLTDDSLVPSCSGSAMRDGQLVGRRISSPAFPSLTGGQAMSNPFVPSPGTTLSITVALPADDPTNPFRHLYHPEHTSAPSYAVTRTITLTFADADPEGRPITGVPSLGWGSSEGGGIYAETITGLHKEPLNIEGTFLLHKASDVDTLTTAPCPQP